MSIANPAMRTDSNRTPVLAIAAISSREMNSTLLVAQVQIETCDAQQLIGKQLSGADATRDRLVGLVPPSSMKGRTVFLLDPQSIAWLRS